jgi:hypothetical protein
LGDEFADDSNIVHRSLGVGYSHDSGQEVDFALFPAVIPSILRTRSGMEINVDTKTIFSGPLDGFEEVRPRRLGEERFIGVDFDNPKGKWDAGPFETGSGDLS